MDQYAYLRGDKVADAVNALLQEIREARQEAGFTDPASNGDLRHDADVAIRLAFGLPPKQRVTVELI